MKISAVIITYNEAHNIDRCLSSLLSVVDELIVVDSFSDDETENICKKYGVKFIQHIFEGHIEQKNYAVSQTNYDYVLSLDADEALSETLQKSILSIKTTLDYYDAYSMNRMTNYCGQWIKHGGWYPDCKIRLWKKARGKWGGLNPHDKIIILNRNSLKHIEGDILHYSYYQIAEHYKQADKFATIAASAYYKSGRRSSIFHISISPLMKFIRNYILKLGFLDGKFGFTIAKISAIETYWKYKRLYKL